VLIESDPAAIARALVRQASGPVRWVELVQALANGGVTHVIECGPGKVLGGMIKRIAPSIETLAVFDTASLNAALTSY
jgi:[acyl-carrier-protein] S-malonyltransferase